jgi:tetratricopeptide (TPR) repeat protein
MRPEIVEAVRGLINAGGFQQTEAVIAKYGDELASAEARHLIALQLPRHASHSREHRVISARLNAIERAMNEGTPAVFAGYAAAAQAILTILNAQNWNEVRSAIAGNRHHLLSPVADIAFADLVMQPSTPEEESQVLAGWSLVEQCRALGVEAALEAVPEIASSIARRAEGAAQMARWNGFTAYSAAMQALATPTDRPERIAVCRAALASIDRDALPIVWALVALDLAGALGRQTAYPAWDPATDPMDEVISLYRRALEILTPEGEPEQFAHAQQALGDAHLRDPGGDAAQNAEAAIGCYEAALGLRKRATEPARWAAIMAHLGEALLRRAHGDPSIDVDRAVHVLEQAIEVLEESRENTLLATARLSLAAALTARITGSRDANLVAAARQLRTAMDDVQPDEHADIWAMASAHLGSVYLSRARTDLHEREQLLKKAERHFRAALGVAEAGPRSHARAHAGLAWALSDQAAGGAAADAEAIEHHEAAIAIYGQLGPAFDVERAHAHRNLAIQYSERAVGDEGENIAAAERHFAEALTLFPPDEYAVEHRDTFRPMATMYFEARRWADAHRCFEQAIAMSGDVLAGRRTRPGKEAEAAENRGLYGPAAYCLLQLGQPGEALETLERGKARMLAEALAGTEAPGVAGRLDLQSMLAEIPEGGALVAPIVTTRGSAALVVPAGAGAVTAEHVVALESLTVSALMNLLGADAAAGGWLNAYLHWLQARDTFDELFAALDSVTSALWDHLMGPVHARLGALGMTAGAPVLLMPSGWLGVLPLHAARGMTAGRWTTFGTEYVVSYAPSVGALRACRRRLEAEERRGGALVAVANPTGDLAFADAEATSIATLFAERAGAPDAVRVFSTAAATRAAVLDAVGRASYVHFACHAEFHWTNPAQSGLLLAGGDRLRMEDILSRAMDLASSRLVTLSACESGMAEFRTMPDEFIGLPGALLEAGAPAVISSLWPVDDVSTKLLLTEMYRAHLDGLGIAAALRAAQQWLREATAEDLGLAETYRHLHAASGGANATSLEAWRYYEANPNVMPFAHSYYWAAFTATGAA